MLSKNLHLFILHSKVILNPSNIYLVANNQYDKTTHAYQCYWIAEAIHYNYYVTIKKLFNNTINKTIKITWPELFSVDWLSPYYISHYILDSILENEDIISSIFGVIDIVFLKQLRYDYGKNFRRLYFIYGD